MFGVDSSELIIIALAALIFIGPKELPATLRTLGRTIARVRAYTHHFTGGISAMMREAELKEMEARWRADMATADRPVDPATERSTAAVPPLQDRVST